MILKTKYNIPFIIVNRMYHNLQPLESIFILIALSLIRQSRTICPEASRRAPTEEEWYNWTQFNNLYEGKKLFCRRIKKTIY